MKFLLKIELITDTLDKHICKQNAMISAKESYQQFRQHFCHQCREYQEQVHYCQFTQAWIQFDQRNMVIIQGKTRAAVERKAGFGKEIHEEEELKGDKKEYPIFEKLEFDDIAIFRSRNEMNLSLKNQRIQTELYEKEQVEAAAISDAQEKAEKDKIKTSQSPKFEECKSTFEEC